MPFHVRIPAGDDERCNAFIIYLFLHATIPRSSYKIREAFVHIEC